MDKHFCSQVEVIGRLDERTKNLEMINNRLDGVENVLAVQTAILERVEKTLAMTSQSLQETREAAAEVKVKTSALWKRGIAGGLGGGAAVAGIIKLLSMFIG